MTTPARQASLNDSEFPRMTVVTPSYNQARYLPDTLDSVLGQGYPNLEYIVIDGGSDDGTVDILQRYHDRLTSWISEPDQGQAHAVNKGFDLATGDIFCWLNSDDMLLPGALRDVAHRFDGRTDSPGLLYGGAITMREGTDRLDAGCLRVQDYDRALLCHYDYIVQPSAFWTRALWEAAGPLDQSKHYVLDWDWFIRASAHAPFEAVQKFYSIYRFHDAHKTGSGGEARRKEIVQTVARYADEYWAMLFEATAAVYDDLSADTQMHLPRGGRCRRRFNRRYPGVGNVLQDPHDLTPVLIMLGGS